MSPYIVTTKRFNDRWSASPNVVSRRAVATLEEARDILDDLGMALPEDVLDESGGTVGPLPDGTVIEVEPWEDGPMRAWANFYGPANVTSASSAAEIIDAYNARQS